MHSELLRDNSSPKNVFRVLSRFIISTLVFTTLGGGFFALFQSPYKQTIFSDNPSVGSQNNRFTQNETSSPVQSINSRLSLSDWNTLNRSFLTVSRFLSQDFDLEPTEVQIKHSRKRDQALSLLTHASLWEENPMRAEAMEYTKTILLLSINKIQQGKVEYEEVLTPAFKELIAAYRQAAPQEVRKTLQELPSESLYRRFIRETL